MTARAFAGGTDHDSFEIDYNYAASGFTASGRHDVDTSTNISFELVGVTHLDTDIVSLRATNG